MEGLRNLWVHVDQKILLLCQFLVATDNLVLDPSGEGLSDDRVSHVYEPLARDLVYVTIFGKVVRDFRVLLGRLKYARNAEILVLRDVHDFHVVAFDAARFSETKASTYYLRFPVTRSLRK